ncbi:8-oxo-dGTP diphosphatase MutT [Marinomonas communis]|uniref:8-oxo-dGTP diphosphatase n=1 Tax=Marinomonas communis TaxID=28254 RepID=A0A4R6X6P2_9GAMM|nr:8-oxo-dGTP diphosphatase MutT [Marinomonas communis]TDR14722.1 8-oxo-dGTPase [Marinomonas communis]
MVIRVAAGVIIRNEQVFIALRSQDKHQGGCWEFPGGKVETDEEPQAALERELQEECGIEVIHSQIFKLIKHDYPDKSVELHFFKVTDFSGEAHGKEGQEVAWVPVADLANYRFPEANVPVVDALLDE